MKVLLSTRFGGFKLPAQWLEDHGLSPDLVYEKRFRYHLDLIEDIENGMYPEANLAVVDVPDDASDWAVDEYDGKEWIVFVRGGELWKLTSGNHSYKWRGV